MLVTSSPFEEVVETLHGTPVHDPYRWLEDSTLPETRAWIDAQRAQLERYFAGAPLLDVFRDRVREYLVCADLDQPCSVNGTLFYRWRDAESEQYSIRARGPEEAEERILVDPSKDGPFATVLICRISSDAALLAYEHRIGGEHTRAIHIVDVRQRRILEDFLPTGYARGFVFAAGNRGFYYCHEPATPSESGCSEHVVRYHAFGASPDADPILFRVTKSPDSKLVLIGDDNHLGCIHYQRHDGAYTASLYVAAQSMTPHWQCVCTGRSTPFSAMLRNGEIFVQSWESAPNGELICLSPSGARLRTVIPDTGEEIRQLAVIGDRLYAGYVIEGEPVIRIWSFSGEHLGELPIDQKVTPQLCPAYSQNADSLFYITESFHQPPAVFRYHPSGQSSELVFRKDIRSTVEKYELERVTCTSRDGTSIPMWLVASSKPLQSRQRPTILTAYGASGFCMLPQFTVFVSILLELGFVFALPLIRGGGEFGRKWHEAGRRRNRQNSIDDFLAASQWLVDQRITTPRRLAIFGGSFSGLLVAAAVTQRPDLYGAVLCLSPLLDMVRYHLFDRAIVWADEFGTADDAEDFTVLLGYSPYHQVEEATSYPSMLFITGELDTRCNPAHVRKMAARLQNRHIQKNPILVDYSRERGHAAGMPLSVRIEGLARRLFFIVTELGLAEELGRHCDSQRHGSHAAQ
jgi:prolyl oligopeptidase